MLRAMRVFMARTLPPALLLLALFAPTRASAAPPRLLASDARGATFEIDVPEPRIATLESASGRYQKLELDDFDSDARVGFPVLPARAILVAVPEGARVSVTAAAEGERLYEGLRIAPQQDAAWALAQEKSGARTLNALVEDAGAYARAGWDDVPLASVVGVTGMRAQRVARIVVRPAQYDPALGRVRVWSRVRVSVAFEGGAGSALRVPASARPDPFEDLYKELVNYESGRAWRTDFAAGTLRARGLVPDAVQGPLGTVREDFSSSPNWIKIEVSSKGIYRVDAADLAVAGANVAAIDPRTIRVFAQPGVPPLDEINPPQGWMNEAAISVVGEGDGRLDTSDYVLFYGLGSSGWKDEFGVAPPDSELQRWMNHPYETKNFYWLTWGGSFSTPPHRWATRSGAQAVPLAWQAPDFTARIHFEADLDYNPNLQAGAALNARTGIFWEKWTWVNATDTGGAVPITFALPNAIASRPARLRARLWGNSTLNQRSPGFADHYLNVSVNTTTFGERAFYGFLRQDYDTTFVDPKTAGNLFRVLSRRVVDPNPLYSRVDRTALFWFDVDYPRTFTPTGNFLDFRSPDTTAVVDYALGPFTSTAGFLLLDTTDPFNVTASRTTCCATPQAARPFISRTTCRAGTATWR
jgi:hypothetical protein